MVEACHYTCWHVTCFEVETMLNNSKLCQNSAVLFIEKHILSRLIEGRCHIFLDRNQFTQRNYSKIILGGKLGPSNSNLRENDKPRLYDIYYTLLIDRQNATWTKLISYVYKFGSLHMLHHVRKVIAGEAVFHLKIPHVSLFYFILK